jgi:hypothetical protein
MASRSVAGTTCHRWTPSPIAEQDLVDEVTTHNQVAHEINARFDALAEARHALNRDDDWSGHDAKAIIAERRRVVAESWDVLVLLRRWVDERTALTRKIAAHIGGQMDELTERHDAAFQAVHQKLERENRRYLKTRAAPRSTVDHGASRSRRGSVGPA